MMRSMYSGVSGLRVHQTKMDVIGNNIANVNTLAYKSNSVTFSEVFYQTTQGASGPNEDTGKGGQNAKQIGLGSSIGAITSNIETEGSSQRTDNPFDLKLSGTSFFVVKNSGSNFYTRAGNFTVDQSGRLVTPNGLTVQGWGTDDEGNIIKSDIDDLYIKSEEFTYTSPVATTHNTISGNLNREDSSFAKGDIIPINVKFYDSLGYSYMATVNISQSTEDTSQYTMEAGRIMCDGKVVEGYTFSLDQSNLSFDVSTGKCNLDSFVLTVNTPDNATPIDPITVDLTNLKSLGDETSIMSDYGAPNGSGAGKAVGKMTGVSIQTDGKIAAYYSNGDVRTLGQIVVSNFLNPSGLEKVGENLYQATLNSGEPTQDDISANGGQISSGILEMSNVDLSSEFTEMITTQRGFQANSRIITVSDTLLEELINLKR